MLTQEEEKFLSYWQENRLKEKSLFKQLSAGFAFGLLLGLAIILNLVSGWYTRADMAAYGESTPYVLLLAILIITVFCGVFYRRHRWEMNEQHFLELKKKKEATNSLHDMQQNNVSDSQ